MSATPATPRVTVASLAARLDRTDAALADLTGVLGVIAERLNGQHNTPAAVTEITAAPSARKSTAKKAKGKGKTKVAPAVTTKREMPAEVREGFAMVKATKDAISPLNKALAQVCKGQPWVKAHERTPEQIAEALALVAADPEHGEKAAKAALDALTVRYEAAQARSK